MTATEAWLTARVNEIIEVLRLHIDHGVAVCPHKQMSPSSHRTLRNLVASAKAQADAAKASLATVLVCSTEPFPFPDYRNKAASAAMAVVITWREAARAHLQILLAPEGGWIVWDDQAGDTVAHRDRWDDALQALREALDDRDDPAGPVCPGCGGTRCPADRCLHGKRSG